MFLLTASEIVLGTAIIMGLSAIVTVLLRICARPPYVRRSQTGSIVPDEFGRVGNRMSLTSLQQRVMSKLRDRPPRYETRHNYEYQRRSQSSLPATLNPAAASNVPPPAYESSDNNSVSLKLNSAPFTCLTTLLLLLLFFSGARASAHLHHCHRRQRWNLESFVCRRRRECGEC
jgi:hypothetical protein